MQSKQTMMAFLIAFVAIGLAGIGTYLAWPQPDDEERIRITIYEVAAAARAADLTATIEPLDTDYSDASGLSRDEVTGLLFREYRARGPISVFVHNLAVTVEGESATATFDAVLADGVNVTQLDLVPDNADLFQFELELHKKDGDWLIIRSQHVQASR